MRELFCVRKLRFEPISDALQQPIPRMTPMRIVHYAQVLDVEYRDRKLRQPAGATGQQALESLAE